MNRKMISLLLALILASGTLASCANPKDPAETAGTESESATDTTPVETEPETVRYAAEARISAAGNSRCWRLRRRTWSGTT